MKHRNPLIPLFGWIAINATILPAVRAAEGAPPATSSPPFGSLEGQVSNQATRAFLEGASLAIEGTSIATASGRQGEFRLDGIPPGRHVLVADYTGLDPQRIPVTIAAGAATKADVVFRSDVYVMEKLQVDGLREGTAKAVMLQREAPNVKSVVSSDTFGNIADGNVGDLLQHLPGVSADYVGAEVRTVRIRGIAPNLNSVSIDGTRLASSQSAGTGRQFEFETAALGSIETIEVTKAPTPEMDADSIGGSVNLRTKSAFDRSRERRIRFSAAVTYGAENKVPDYTQWGKSGSFEYSEVFGSARPLGVVVNLAYHLANEGTTTTISTYENKVADPVYTSAFTGPRPAPGPRTRTTSGVKFDFRVAPRTTLSLGATFNRFEEQSHPRVFLIQTQAAIAVFNAAGVRTAGAIKPDYTNLVTEALQTTNTFANIQVQHVTKKGLTYQVTPGLRHDLGDLKIDADASLSRSSTNYDIGNTTTRLTNIGWRLTRATPEDRYPKYVQTAGSDMYNLNNYGNYQFTREFRDGADRIEGGQVNLRKSLPAREYPLMLKAGLRYRAHSRRVNRYQQAYTYIGTDPLSKFLDPGWNYSAPVVGYRSPPYQSSYVTADILKSSPQQFSENIANTISFPLLNALQAREEIGAGYVLGNLTLGKLDLLAGVRFEGTRVEGRGPKQEITREEAARRAAFTGPLTNDEIIRRTRAEYGGRQKAEGSYDDAFPSVHLRYRPTRAALLRASWSTSIGRPEFGDIIPLTRVDHVAQTVTSTNTRLKPQYSHNYDLSAEYYFEPIGVVSAGFFRKNIKDFIFSSRGRLIGAGSDNGFGGDYNGYELISSANGGAGKVQGYELNYTQHFSFLPGFWSGFGLNTNYSRMTTSGNYASGGTTTQSTNEIAGFVPETANVALSYGKYGFSLRLEWTLRSSFLDAYSTDPSRLSYNYERKFYNIKASYRLTRHYEVYFTGLNVTNEPSRNRYWGVPSRYRDFFEDTPRYYLGVNGNY